MIIKIYKCLKELVVLIALLSVIVFTTLGSLLIVKYLLYLTMFGL